MRRTAVRTAEIRICMVKQPPKIRWAVSWSPFPMAMEALGAPPELTKAAKAETMRIRGIQTPKPVRAKLPVSGIWPM